MAISASQVSELRKLTDCGLMDCKKALEESNGDLELAVETLRKKGMAKAAKKADRVASEGIIKIKVSEDGKQAIMLEINSETDFVARDENFQQFAESIAVLALSNSVQDAQQLAEVQAEADKTVDQVRHELIAKIGENVHIRRVALLETTGMIGAYVHGHKIGVLLSMTGGNAELAKDIAMHITASKPMVVSPDQIDSAVIEQEKKIYKTQALESGKPENIVEKMVEGKLKKFTSEISLVGQPFVKNPDISVGDLLKEQNAQVDTFVRFELGEGIEKAESNFAEEVMAQVNQNS